MNLSNQVTTFSSTLIINWGSQKLTSTSIITIFILHIINSYVYLLIIKNIYSFQFPQCIGMSYRKQSKILIETLSIHIHLYLRKMLLTLVWNDQQCFYRHHYHINILPILFVYVKFQSIASLLSYSINLITPANW